MGIVVGYVVWKWETGWASHCGLVKGNIVTGLIAYFKIDITKLEPRLSLYLVSAPIPDGWNSHSHKHPWPGQVGGHGVPEEVESVLSRQSTAGVCVTDRGNGVKVFILQPFPPVDLNKACGLK